MTPVISGTRSFERRVCEARHEGDFDKKLAMAFTEFCAEKTVFGAILV